MNRGDLGGYTDVARAINDRYNPEYPVRRQNVLLWNDRRTLNRNGDAFPSPVREIPGVTGQRKPRLVFRLSQCVEWYGAGVPEKYGAGWRRAE